MPSGGDVVQVQKHYFEQLFSALQESISFCEFVGRYHYIIISPLSQSHLFFQEPILAIIFIPPQIRWLIISVLREVFESEEGFDIFDFHPSCPYE